MSKNEHEILINSVKNGGNHDEKDTRIARLDRNWKMNGTR